MNLDLSHALVIVAALAAYCALTIAGADGNPVFAFLGGQGVAVATERIARRR